MNAEQKKSKIKELALAMLLQSYEAMCKKVDKAIKAVGDEVENWDENNNSMILPKCVVTALLQDESTQYDCVGTVIEKQVKAEVKNIRYHL